MGRIGFHNQVRAGHRTLQSATRRAAVRASACVAAAALVAFSACSSGDLPLETVDPNAAPLHPTYDQAAVILQRACAPCHASGGAPPPGGEHEDLDYSTCQGIQFGLDGIRRTAIRKGSMPPGAWPRLDERERLILQRWIDQGACSPCTPCR